MITRTARSTAAIYLSLAVLTLAVGAASAQAAPPKRIGVVKFQGPAEGATRNAVMKAAKAAHYQIVGGTQIDAAAKHAHVRLEDNDSFKTIAKTLGLTAIVTGEVTKKKATLAVRNGDDGTVLAEASWAGPNPRKLSAAVGKTFWKRMGSAVDRAKAPSGAKTDAVAQEETAPETGADEGGGDDAPAAKAPAPPAADDAKAKSNAAETTSASADAPETASRSRAKSKKTSSDDSSGDDTTTVAKKADTDDSDEPGPLPALDIAAGPRLTQRSLTYTGNRAGLPKYSLPSGAPVLTVAADVFPAALLGATGFAADLGLTADVSYLLPVVKSASPMGGSYSTSSVNWSVGVKVRLPYGLYATGGYGAHFYKLIPSADVPVSAPTPVPMTDYHFVRVGLGARLEVSPSIALMANGAYLQCLGTLGQISYPSYFPHGTGAGFEGGVAVGYRLTPSIEARAGADMQRFGLAFNVKYSEYQANPNIMVAGGAIDQYVSGWVSVAILLGGESSGKGARGAHESSGDGDTSSPPATAPATATANKSDKSGDDEDENDDSPPKKSK